MNATAKLMNICYARQGERCETDVRLLERFLPGLDTGHALIIFETEGRFVAFGDFIAARVNHIESREHFHRVVMPEKKFRTFVRLFFVILISTEYYLNNIFNNRMLRISRFNGKSTRLKKYYPDSLIYGLQTIFTESKYILCTIFLTFCFK